MKSWRAFIRIESGQPAMAGSTTPYIFESAQEARAPLKVGLRPTAHAHEVRIVPLKKKRKGKRY